MLIDLATAWALLLMVVVALVVVGRLYYKLHSLFYRTVKKSVKIQLAPKTGKISVDKIQRAVDSVSKRKKRKE